jgi:hypothetical protein
MWSTWLLLVGVAVLVEAAVQAVFLQAFLVLRPDHR